MVNFKYKLIIKAMAPYTAPRYKKYITYWCNLCFAKFHPILYLYVN